MVADASPKTHCACFASPASPPLWRGLKCIRKPRRSWPAWRRRLASLRRSGSGGNSAKPWRRRRRSDSRGPGKTAGCLSPWFPELETAAIDPSLDGALPRYGGLGWSLSPSAVKSLSKRLLTPKAHLRLALDVAHHGRALSAWRDWEAGRTAPSPERHQRLSRPAAAHGSLRRRPSQVRSAHAGVGGGADAH